MLYQTVVRLGTYTAKVPIYNSLKACKGTMFFLPLPLNKTLDTLDQIEHSSNAASSKSALPDPEPVHYSQWYTDERKITMAYLG